MSISKNHINHRGKTISRWSFREGNVIEQNDAFIARIYVRYAHSLEETAIEPTEIFAVVRGNTEQQCSLRAHKLMELCLAGEFDDIDE